MANSTNDPVLRVHDALLAALKANPTLAAEISAGNWIAYEGRSEVPPRAQKLTHGGQGSTLPSDFPYLWLRLGGGSNTLGNREPVTFDRRLFIAERVRTFLITVGYDDMRIASSVVIDTAIDDVLERAWSNRLGLPDIVANIEPISVTVDESAKSPEVAGSFRRFATWEIPILVKIKYP